MQLALNMWGVSYVEHMTGDRRHLGLGLGSFHLGLGLGSWLGFLDVLGYFHGGLSGNL